MKKVSYEAKLPRNAMIGPRRMQSNVPREAVVHQLYLVAAILSDDALLLEEFPRVLPRKG